MKISVVIPCYNSEATIEKVVDLVVTEFKKTSYEYEFVLVNDHSKDNTFSKIRGLAASRSYVKGVDLLRNFGQHNALMAGLNYTSGDYILGMDDDLQTHPSQIFELVYKLEEGFDLVYGIYKKRKNSLLKNFSSKLNEVTSRIMLGRPREICSSNFWIITRKIRNEVIKYENFNPYIDAIFYRTTHNIGNVVIEHHKREIGTSNYTLRKLIRLWLAYWNYSVVPLRISSILGFFSACGGFIAVLVIIIKKFLTPDLPVGWSSTICIMVTFFGLILLVLGIMGEYLGKILLCINNTPQYIVRETLNLEDFEKED